MSAVVDPFEGSLEDLQKEAFKEKLAKFLKAFNAKDSDAVGQMRKDPQVEWIFQFTHYYDAANATPQRTTVMKDIEMKYPSIAKAYYNGKLKAMLVGKGRRKKTPSRRKTNGGRRRKTRRNP